MKGTASITLGALAATLLMACADSPMPTSLQRPPRCPLTLGPEDVVTIRVFDEEQLSGDYQADTNGIINFHHIGRIDIRGKTNTSLADDIATRLREGDLILNPQVSVVIKEHASARIVVDGQVARPGNFPFRTGLTILEAISAAGGMTPMANRRDVRLTRNTGDGTASMTVPVRAMYEGRQPDIALCPGDSIYVTQSVL